MIILVIAIFFLISWFALGVSKEFTEQYYDPYSDLFLHNVTWWRLVQTTKYTFFATLVFYLLIFLTGQLSSLEPEKINQ